MNKIIQPFRALSRSFAFSRSYFRPLSRYFSWPSRSLFALFAFAFLIRLAGLNKGIWLDESSSIELINQPHFLTALRHYDHPPLYFILLKISSLVSQSEPWLRLLSVFSSVGVVIMLFLWLKPYHFQGALLAALLAATMPVMLEYAHEIRNYALLLLTTTSAFYFAPSPQPSPKGRGSQVDSLLPLGEGLGVRGLALSLTVATHLVGVMVLPTIIVFMGMSFALAQQWPSPKLVGQTLAACAVATSLFLYLYFIFLPPELQARSSATWWMPSASLPQVLVTLKYLFGLPTLLGSNSLTTAIATPMGLGVTILALLFMLPMLMGDWRMSLPFLAAALTYWFCLWLISTLTAPIFIARTALPGMIPMLAFIGLQIATIPRPRLKVWSMIAVIILSSYSTFLWVTQTAWQPIERWQPIAQALQREWRKDDLVIFYPGYIEGPTRYYWSSNPPFIPPDSGGTEGGKADSGGTEGGIPPESIVTIWIGGDLSKLGQTREQVNLIEARHFTSAVFLVWRDDQNIAHEPEVYAELQQILTAKFGSPQELAHVGNLYVLKYAR